MLKVRRLTLILNNIKDKKNREIIIKFKHMIEANKFPPIHPGEIIQRRFFETRNLTVEKVAKDTHLPTYQLQELVVGKRNIDTDIAYRLGLYFQVGAEGFLNLQQIYDLEI